MNYALARKYPLYLSPKTRSSKPMMAGSRIFSRRFSERSSPDSFKTADLTYEHRSDRRHGGCRAEMGGRLCLGVQELRWRRAVRHGGAGFRLTGTDDQCSDDTGRKNSGIGSRTRHGNAALSRNIKRVSRPRPIPSHPFLPGRVALRIAPNSTVIPTSRVLLRTLRRFALRPWSWAI